MESVLKRNHRGKAVFASYMSHVYCHNLLYIVFVFLHLICQENSVVLGWLKYSKLHIRVTKRTLQSPSVLSCPGKLRSNFLGLEFMAYGEGMNPKKSLGHRKGSEEM